MASPLVDITTINAAQSLFSGSVRDPWARQCAGHLADLFIYSEKVRFALPVPATLPHGVDLLTEPSLLSALAQRDSTLLKPEPYSTAEPFLLKDEYLSECFQGFKSWARANRQTLRRWITLHNQPWILDVQRSRAQHGLVFSLESLEKEPELALLAREVEVTLDDICYAFDVVLRYPLYGALAGPAEHYLSHPIREAFLLPTMSQETGVLPEVPISFRNSIGAIAHSLTQDQYAVVLHELRHLVRDKGINRVKPGEVDRDVLREIAAQVALRPRLARLGKLVGFASGLVGAAGAVAAAGPPAAILGGALSVLSTVWTGGLPRFAARIRWLRWAIRWDLEDQAERRE